MRYHTKEYYTLLMSLDAAACYEPTIDKENYTEEDIAELYQQAMDKYIEDERAMHDAPPEYMVFEEEPDEELLKIRDMMFAAAVDEYENRGPFDEEEAKADFEEMYEDSLEEPDEDLPDWVREAVDPRLLAMDLMPEKIYRKLAEEDAANEARFDSLDDAADEALEAARESLPERYREFVEAFEDLEDSTVVRMGRQKERLEIMLTDWDENGNEVPALLRFTKPEILEDDGVEVRSWKDEDGDTDSDCEFLYGELYMEDGRPEVHMLFDNNGLKYLTLRCDEAAAEHDRNSGTAVAD